MVIDSASTAHSENISSQHEQITTGGDSTTLDENGATYSQHVETSQGAVGGQHSKFASKHQRENGVVTERHEHTDAVESRGRETETEYGRGTEKTANEKGGSDATAHRTESKGSNQHQTEEVSEGSTLTQTDADGNQVVLEEGKKITAASSGGVDREMQKKSTTTTDGKGSVEMEYEGTTRHSGKAFGGRNVTSKQGVKYEGSHGEEYVDEHVQKDSAHHDESGHGGRREDATQSRTVGADGTVHHKEQSKFSEGAVETQKRKVREDTVLHRQTSDGTGRDFHANHTTVHGQTKKVQPISFSIQSILHVHLRKYYGWICMYLFIGSARGIRTTFVCGHRGSEWRWIHQLQRPF